MAKFVKVEVHPDFDARMQALMKDIGATAGYQEVLSAAVTFLEWGVGEVKKGKSVGSIDEAQETFAALDYPPLKKAKTGGN